MANKIMTKLASHEEIIIISHHHRKYYYCQLCILNINYINKYIKNKNHINYFQFCKIMLATHIIIIIIIITIIINRIIIINITFITHLISITSSCRLGQQFFHLCKFTIHGCNEQQLVVGSAHLTIDLEECLLSNTQVMMMKMKLIVIISDINCRIIQT